MKRCLACVAVIGLAAGSASAADKTWAGTSAGNWGVAGTWTPSGKPAATNSVSLNGTGQQMAVYVTEVATNIALNNASGTMTLALVDNSSLTVGGPITDTGAGDAAITVINTTKASAATRLVASSIAARDFTATGYLTTGYNISLAVQLSLASGSLFTQTGGTITANNGGYGLAFVEAGTYNRAPLTTRYVLNGGLLAPARIGVGNANGNNTLSRWIEYGVLTFNDGTIRNQTTDGTLSIQNGSGFLTYTNQPGGVKDMQMAVHHPLTLELAQSGTHTFEAQGDNGIIYLTPSVQLVNKAGEAGTLRKTGAGTLYFTGGAPSGNAPDGSAYAVNSYTGATTVAQGTVAVGYNKIAGYAGGGVLSNAYSKGSKLILNGGFFSLVGRPNAEATSRTAAGLSTTGYGVTLNSTSGLVIGQPVTHANLPAGTYIRTISSGTAIGLSHMATVTTGSTTLEFGAANFSSVQEIDEVEVQSDTWVGVSPAGDATLLTFGNLSGNKKVSKSGSNGTLSLLGTNDFGGALYVAQGTLNFAPASGRSTLTNLITGSGIITKSGAGTIRIDASYWQANTFSGAVVVVEGTLEMGSTAPSLPPAEGLNFAAFFTVNTNGTLVCIGSDPLNSGATVTLNGGTLKGSPVGVGGHQTIPAITLNNGTLVSGTGLNGNWNSLSLNRTITVGGSAGSSITTQNSGYSGVHLTWNAAADGTMRTFDVADATGDATSDLVVSAPLLNSSNAGKAAGLIKTGAGTMLLSAENIYKGQTIISNGTVLVSGNITNSAVTVAAGAAFGAAGTTVSPRVASLTLDEGSKVVWSYDGEAHTAGRIIVTGTLTLPAAATIDVSGIGDLSSSQVLFTAGSVAGASNLDGWTLNGVPTNARVVVNNNQVILQPNKGTLIRIF